jgi:malate/lactate dehydrogenase
MGNIAVIGVGKLGTRLAEEIVRKQCCEKLYLWNRSRRRLQGTILSLDVLASVLRSRTRVLKLTDADIPHVDLVVIAVKDSYDPRDLLQDEKYPRWFPVDVRTVGFRRDLPLVREVCSKLTGYSRCVVVITNPLDVFVTLVKQWLPAAEVVGLGVSLDAARLLYSLPNRVRHKVDSWHDTPVAGEHGKHLVPMFSMWKYSPEELSLTPHDIGVAITKGSHIGPDIVKGLGYTLHDCAAVFSDDLDRLLGRRNGHRKLFVSFGDADAAVGVPIVFSRKTECLVPYKRMPDRELAALHAARENISALVHRIREHEPFAEYIHG